MPNRTCAALRGPAKSSMMKQAGSRTKTAINYVAGSYQLGATAATTPANHSAYGLFLTNKRL